ncbi:hypothetical protein HanXRQr2_Chr12g0542981 [Helianthus annuus]|uniref:Uncharacterized protein n=1 Tax=Helianthus annuus TaxID=4232 RepID=A0A9K3HGS7_HELAN|nr:hypothetical protein HanXRQr2_Chr12g0542981 [Helianthus annuus]KAJ0862817.1 hypothetical protein HanPSC8_Chr12g0522721 [Helianthus annuus]
MNLRGYLEKHQVTLDLPLTLSTANLPVSIFTSQLRPCGLSLMYLLPTLHSASLQLHYITS